jgi:hypothetical protein
MRWPVQNLQLVSFEKFSHPMRCMNCCMIVLENAGATREVLLYNRE